MATNGSVLENRFAFYWRALGGPKLEREFLFHPTRKWRFDFADPKSKVAIEVEGGIYTGGRHTKPLGFIEDCEKYNEAAFLGWRVFRLPGKLITSAQLESIKTIIHRG